MIFKYASVLMADPAKLVQQSQSIRDSLFMGVPVSFNSFLHPNFSEALKIELDNSDLWSDSSFKSQVFNPSEVNKDIPGYRLSKCSLVNMLDHLLNEDFRGFLSSILDRPLGPTEITGHFYGKGSQTPWEIMPEESLLTWSLVLSDSLDLSDGGTLQIASSDETRTISDDYSLDGQISVELPNVFNTLHLVPGGSDSFWRRSEVSTSQGVMTLSGTLS